MSKYVLNEETALVLNGEVYVLAREKEITENSVCEKCSLYNYCVDFEDIRRLSSLCIPDDGDQSWFFQRHYTYSEKGGKDLVRLINKWYIHK